MRKRWKLRCFLALVLAIELFAVWYRLPPRVSWENAWTIQKGMTRAEVVSILGPPAAESFTPNTAPATSSVAHWRSNAAWVNVAFNATDRVEWVQITNLQAGSDVFDLFKSLARLWRRWLAVH